MAGTGTVRPLRAGVGTAPSSTGNRVAIADDRGVRTFRETHERTNALAAGMSAVGLAADDAVGLLSRDHVGMVAAGVSGDAP